MPCGWEPSVYIVSIQTSLECTLHPGAIGATGRGAKEQPSTSTYGLSSWFLFLDWPAPGNISRAHWGTRSYACSCLRVWSHACPLSVLGCDSCMALCCCSARKLPRAHASTSEQKVLAGRYRLPRTAYLLAYSAQRLPTQRGIGSSVLQYYYWRVRMNLQGLKPWRIGMWMRAVLQVAPEASFQLRSELVSHRRSRSQIRTCIRCTINASLTARSRSQ
jgi:hypothetical protein